MEMGDIEPSKERILVVVHPGSCCGSADMTLGRYDADGARNYIIGTLREWDGGVLIIDGELSDELEDGAGRRSWRELGEAIEAALETAKAKGMTSERLYGSDGEDEDQVLAIRSFVEQRKLESSDCEFALTGAWYSDDGESGCVTSVEEELRKLGFDPEVLSCAVREPDETPDPEDEAEDNIDAGPTPAGRFAG